MGGIEYLLVEVYIGPLSPNPGQINKFDWLGREIGRKWSLEQQWSLGLEEVGLLGEEDPLL